MPFGAEIVAALRLGSRLGPSREDAGPGVVVAGLALLPAVGLVLGFAAALVTRAVAPLGDVAAGLGGAVTLALLGGEWPRASLWPVGRALLLPGDEARVLARLRAGAGVGGALVALGWVLLAAAAIAAIPAPARSGALLLAPALARWAMVVQCHGGRSGYARGAAAAVVGRARFQEFGWASVLALGVALAVGEAVGLLAAVVAASSTLGVRLLAHRRLGGLTGRVVAATGGLVEVGVLALLAGLA